MFKIVFSAKAKEQYDELNVVVRKKVNRVVDYLGINPFFGSNIKKLKGKLQDYYRFRIGDFRIIYCFSEEEVVIMVIEHRGKIY